MNNAPTFHEHDTSLSLWLDDPNDPMVKKARDEVVRLLRRHGWRVQIDQHTKQHYRSIAKDHHHAQKGDLQAHIEASGRSMKIEFFQDVAHENRHGGRYDFNKRQKMPYLIGLQYEATARKVAACIEGLGLPALKRDTHLTGMELINQRRDKLEDFQGRGFYADDKYPAYNCTSAGGTQLRDGQRVWFVSESGATGRWHEGVAFRNINNMWWVRLPGGVVRNQAASRLHTQRPDNLRGRHFEKEKIVQRLEQLKASAVKAENFERAAKLRDAIKAAAQEGGAA